MGKKKGKKQSSSSHSSSSQRSQQEQSQQQSSSRRGGHEKERESSRSQQSQQSQQSRKHDEGHKSSSSSHQSKTSKLTQEPQLDTLKISKSTTSLSSASTSASTPSGSQPMSFASLLSKSSSVTSPSTSSSSISLPSTSSASQKAQPSSSKSQQPQPSSSKSQQPQPSSSKSQPPQRSHSPPQTLDLPSPQKSKPPPQKSQPLPQKSQSTSQQSQPSPQPSTSQSEASVPYTALQEKLSRSVAGQLALSIPVRKNPNICGSRGRPITIEVNVMALEFKNLKTNVSQYDVAVNPEKPKFLRRTIFEEFRKKNFPHRNPAYDGNKIAYSANDLPFKDNISGYVTILDNEQEREFHVEMKKSASIDLSFLKHVRPGFNETLGTQSGIQALDVILRHGPLSFCFPVGRSIFWQPMGRSENLTSGMELWIGSFQSAILGWKPLLNIDVAHKGFPKPQNVIDLMRELCLHGENRDITVDDVFQSKEKVKKYLIGLKVHYVIPNIPSSKRTQVVRGLVDCPRNNVFTRAEGTSCTIEEYFRHDKKYMIRYPYLPCLWIGPENKKIYVPPELCTIVAGQTLRKKMDEGQTAKMIRFAATSTDKRKEKIMEGFRALRINDHPTMKSEFNFSVKAEFERVPARVLEAPKLNYSNNDIVSVTRGVWRAKKFLNPCTLLDKQWTIVNLVDRRIRDREMYNLCQLLRDGARTVGMMMGDAYKPFQSCANTNNDLQICFQHLKRIGIKLVIVIIPDFTESYSLVKQVTELQLGVLTQCIKSGTVERKLNPATIGNILLKINSKLNGVNHEISLQVRPSVLTPDCILIGADVTHPSPDSKNIPSIAAVAASCDKTAFRYKIEIRLQQPRQEIINDFAEIVRRLLVYYYKSTGIQPRKIIIYRDGVSEGQLTQVLHFELSALRGAFESLGREYKPLVTFLVVQKRHHIRFFPTDRRNSDDRNFNVQAGTIVDTHITHPSHIDFYLVSHASIQGTARPTKYKCVFNQLNMSEDQIEELTYYLCHMFARCTRSISYPAPTYYAHLAAFRARAFIQNVPISLSKLSDEQSKIKVVLNEDSPMFYV